MREYGFTFYVVAHVLFLTNLSSCDLRKEDRGERIAGKWKLVKCEFADSTNTVPVPEVETDIEFAATGTSRHCTMSAHCYSYRMDSEFLYLLSKDPDRKCPSKRVLIFKYHLEAGRLRLHVFGACPKSAGRPVSFIYEKKP
jgi:hypothetical protein